ncbi:MAG: phosphoadenylyl-sulfate reductase [Candidatus Latescibacteria bacterium]|nr:phosphoadenylyl-sulfate reductase [Candidatus Latescibacterota bacterium]
MDIEVNNQRLESYLREVDFEAMSAVEILRWAYRIFGVRIVVETSLQNTGVIVIHLAAVEELDMRIALIDTLRLPPESYEFIQTVQQRYGRTIELVRPDPEHIEKMIGRFGEFLFFDSKNLQEYCCQVRKTRPHQRLLKTVDCYISGLRRDHSQFRQDTPKASLVGEEGSRRKILQLNPLADWTEEQVQAFAAEHGVPQHPLYAQGYQSIGCAICSTPTLPGEDKRAGRWRWFNDNPVLADDKKECGLHL